MSFWTYMLHCHGGRFYVGHTDDLDRRIAQHETGAIPGFTRDLLPVTLVWSEYFQTRDEARSCERKLKGWSRAKKMALIRGDWEEISRLAKGKDRPSTGSGQSGTGNESAGFLPSSDCPELVEACPERPPQAGGRSGPSFVPLVSKER